MRRPVIWFATRPRRHVPSAIPVAAATTTDVRLSLVAYSTPREAYDELIPAFQKTQDGGELQPVVRAPRATRRAP